MPYVGHMSYVVHMPISAHLTTAQVAEELGVDVRTVHRWTTPDAEPRLTPHFKMPGRRGGYVFARAEVDRFKAERTEEATA